MPSYKAPVDDVLFLLNDVFQIEPLRQPAGLRRRHRPTWSRRCSARPPSSAEEVLHAAQPRRRRARAARATTTAASPRRRASRRPIEQYADGGWMGISAPAEFGGQGLPETMTHHRQRVPGVGQHGLRHVSGPDAGRDRGDPRARHAGAEGSLPAEDDRGPLDRHHEPDRAALRHRPRPAAHQGGQAGATAATRSPAPRSSSPAGEHDLTENIVHLVLARIEGAPAGTRGISLFIVPKFLLNADGSLGRAQRASPAARSKRRWASTATPPA